TPRRARALPGHRPAERPDQAAGPAGRGQLHAARSPAGTGQPLPLLAARLLPLPAGPRPAFRGHPRRLAPRPDRPARPAPGRDAAAPVRQVDSLVGAAQPRTGAAVGLAAKVPAAAAGRHRRAAAVAAGLLHALRERAALPGPARGPPGAAARPVAARPDAG